MKGLGVRVPRRALRNGIRPKTSQGVPGRPARRPKMSLRRPKRSSIVTGMSSTSTTGPMSATEPSAPLTRELVMTAAQVAELLQTPVPRLLPGQARGAAGQAAGPQLAVPASSDRRGPVVLATVRGRLEVLSTQCVQCGPAGLGAGQADGSGGHVAVAEEPCGLGHDARRLRSAATPRRSSLRNWSRAVEGERRLRSATGRSPRAKRQHRARMRDLCFRVRARVTRSFLRARASSLRARRLSRARTLGPVSARDAALGWRARFPLDALF